MIHMEIIKGNKDSARSILTWEFIKVGEVQSSSGFRLSVFSFSLTGFSGGCGSGEASEEARGLVGEAGGLEGVFPKEPLGTCGHFLLPWWFGAHTYGVDWDQGYWVGVGPGSWMSEFASIVFKKGKGNLVVVDKLHGLTIWPLHKHIFIWSDRLETK